MKTLALLSQKGGSGKSTLAVHLAALSQLKRRTAIIDLDPQRSAAGWFEDRPATTPELVEASADQLRMVLDAARADGVALCVIDTRPSADIDAAAAAAQADLVLIPTRPAVYDLKAIGKTVDIVVKAKAPACWIVLNAVPAGRGGAEASLTIEARRVLADYQTPLARVAIGNRNAFHYALVGGGAVHEFEPAGKATREVRSLWRYVEKQLWPQ